MIRIVIPKPESTADIPFYLSVEEWVARNLPAGEYFFAWQVPPSIICGRHQDIAAEVDLQAAREAGIAVWRRKSGGGAVLADGNNVMFSYITPSSGVETSFQRYTTLICDMLATLGIEAHPTGRNDIAIGGRKVAGNAFLRLPGRSIVHGTMLYDADFDTMARVLTPSRAKKLSKGVVSVPSRVTTLRREGLAIDLPHFIVRAVDFLCAGGESYALTPDDISEIMEIRESYLPLVADVASSHGYDAVCEGYIDMAGSIKVKLRLDGDTISDARITGDFFPVGNLSEAEEMLLGAPLSRPALRNKLKNVENHILGLRPEVFADFIVDNIKTQIP